jgi:hypothetical protein
MDGSGNEFVAGAVTAEASVLPHPAHKTSLYDLTVELFVMADEAASRRADGT